MEQDLYFAITALVTALASIVGAFAQDREPAGFLRSSATVTERQIASVESGQPLVLGLASTEKREIAVIGAVRIDVPSEFFISQYRQIEDFKRSPEVLQIGKFAGVPDAADLQTLTFDPGELRALRKCRSGDCPVKLSKGMLDEFRSGTGPSASLEDSAASMRRTLANYAKDYLRRGDEALVVYNDHGPQVSLSREFQELLEEFSALALYAPEFVDYLKRFPAANLTGVENFVYWSKEKAGFKSVVSLTHVAIYRKDIQERAWFFIASKQIYANHYFEGSLGLTVLSAGTAGNDCWMVYMNRSRTDVLRGWLSSLKKSIIRGRVQGTMKKQMEETKKKLEKIYRAMTSKS